MDYAEEQADEVEALESIFPDELNIISPTKVELPVEFDAGEYKSTKFQSSFDVTVEFTATYPETAPIIHMNNVAGYLEVNHNGQRAGAAKIAEVVEENLGDPLVFTVHAAMVEWLEDYLTMLQSSAENAESIAAAKAEDERLAKLTAGTICDKDTFAVWKEGFMAEIAAGTVTNYTTFIQPKRGKTTGRAIWEASARAKFATGDAEGGDAGVEVDADMFEGLDLDMDDLDLEDSDGED